MGVGDRLHVSVCVTAGKFAQPNVQAVCLLQATVDSIDIVYSTPVTMVEFANKTAFVPKFIVVDEAARLSENPSMALQSKWQNSPCLLIGDTKQFKPLALAAQQRSSKSIFGNQRQVSLFHRIKETRRITHVMRYNHRARHYAARLWANYSRLVVDFSRLFETPNAASFSSLGDCPLMAQGIVLARTVSGAFSPRQFRRSGRRRYGPSGNPPLDEGHARSLHIRGVSSPAVSATG